MPNSDSRLNINLNLVSTRNLVARRLISEVVGGD